MHEKTAGTLGILAAFLVLFSAMLDPRLAAGLAIVALVALSIHTFAQSDSHAP
jgi:hypothetical protein